MSSQPAVNVPQPQTHRSQATSASARPARASLATFPKSERLARLRAALLRAPYEVCTQKAELLTRYLNARPRSRVLELIERVHFRAWLASLAQQALGLPPSRLASTVNRLLFNAYLASERATPGHKALEMAQGLAYVLEHMALRVYDDELVVGNLSSARIGAPLHPDYGGLLLASELDSLSHRPTNPLAIDARQIHELRERVFPYWFRRSILSLAAAYVRDPEILDAMARGEDFVLTEIAGISHLTPDYELVVKHGFRGIERDLGARQESFPRDSESWRFLEAARVSARAAIHFGERWRAQLLASARPSERGQEMRLLADLFARIPAEPAETFHEALQAVFITHVMLHQESFPHGISFGRLDQILLPYYQRDVQAGRLTPEGAVELIGCFLGKAAEQVPLFFARASSYFSGLSSASGITLGGTREDGKDATNELSYLFIFAYDQMRLRQPNLHLRVHRELDPTFFALCAEAIARGGGMPAFFSDEAIIPTLNDSRAHEYAVVGCAEWGVPARSFPACGASFVNLARPLLRALADVREQDVDMTRLLNAYRVRLREVLRQVVEGNNAIEKAHAEHRPTPLLSTLVGGCAEKARDVTAGGAWINHAGIQGVGLADVVDSLSTIDTLVFSERRLSLAALVDIVNSNFKDNELLRLTILNRIPKYGSGDPSVNQYARLVSSIFAEEVGRFATIRGGPYVPGFWSMTTHQGFGQETGALPSGRHSGEPLANGMSPVLGASTRGPTAVLVDVANVTPVGNGAVLNLTLGRDFVAGTKGTSTIRALVDGCFRRGGMQVQIDVLDPGLLRAAKARPEEYRDLVVRISGYSAYFNDLTDAVKDELIARAEAA